MIGRSLWGRIVIAQIVTALLLAVGLPLVIDRTIQRISDDLTSRFLGGMAQQVLAREATFGPEPQLLGAHGPVAIYRTNGSDVVRTFGPPIVDIAARPRPDTAQPVFAHGPYSDFYLLPAGAPGQWVIAAEDRRHPTVLLDDITVHFIHQFAIIVPFALLLSTTATLLAVRSAMGPIVRAADEATKMDPGNLRMRLDEHHVPEEIVPLVHAVNVAFARLEDAYERERVFSATVVHELRTCLSTIALRAGMLDAGVVRRALEEAVQRAAGVIDQMLELQSLEGEVRLGEPIGLQRIAAEVVSDMTPLIASAGRRLTLRIANENEGTVGAAKSPVMIALRNLIENANRHSLPGGAIEVVCDNAAATISVCDEGPGIQIRQDADGRRIFSRADDVRSNSSGLGLAIVDRLMAWAGGELSFGRNSAGGTDAILHFSQSHAQRTDTATG